MKELMIDTSKNKNKMTGGICLNCILLSCLLLYSFCGCFVVKAENESSLMLRSDSLREVLSKTKHAEKQINVLRSLIIESTDQSEEILYLKQMFGVAQELDSIACTYEAINGLTRCYSNQNNLDSLLYWVNWIDSLSIVRNEIPKELLSIHNSLCRSYLVNGEYGLAMNEAVKQQIMAEKSNNKMGFVYCNENLGMVYTQTSRYKEAIDAFETCLALLKETGNAVYESQIADVLIRVYMIVSEYEKAERLLDYYDTIIKVFKLQGKDYLVGDAYSMLYASRIQLYSRMNEPDKVKKAMNDLKPYLEYVSRPYISVVYNLAMANYYFMQKDYLKALDYINKSEEINVTFDFKIQILNILGRKKEALEVYQIALNKMKDKNLTTYIRQIDQLRTIQTLNEEEQQNQSLHRQQQQLKNQKNQVIVLSSFAVILLVSLSFLVRYLVRTKKLRNVLSIEKQSLNKTQENLRVTKDKAERAERMKTEFVANISHEIRTPLNAIIGFSDLLQDSDEEERAEYIKVIDNNSDLLLNLVSDVLDLSRLDTDKYSLNIQEANIEGCCEQVINTICNKVPEGVKLTFTHPENPFMAQTDPLRLQQLLLNLLGNACKFTEKGDINLDYRVDTRIGQIVFTVTDTGCGIPPNKQDVIFERFEKVNDFKQGAGLGLSICMAISNCFGGELYVDSAYTNGARLVFKCPINIQI